jgi:photosystem II stability/assembly factor-like uncharacterized protein
MNSQRFTWRFILFALMAAAIGRISAQAQAPTERDQQIKEIEKQIVDLEAKLKALKERELLPAPKDAGAEGIPNSWIAPMTWRCIGPANMGGRITSIAVYEADPTTYWIATASGGLLRTTNNGVTFEHQFDKQGVVSIGAVAVAQTNKNIVWVGTGEANPRNSVSWGDGVYKSTDGGKTFHHVGLKQSFQIGKIVIHPKNPDIVYVGALGRLYGPNPERGLFKTLDGGKTWQRVLFVDDKTGVIDIAMHPADPETLVVATWERRRDEFDSFRGDAKKPDGSEEYAPATVHGPGSGLYRTTDGGKSFHKLAIGLPNAKMGRIGLDFSRQHPDTLFAIIDTEKAGVGNPPPAQPNVGYLGVTSEDDKAGVKVTAVTENSPAEKAGLKVDDIITHLAEQPVKSYDAFVAELRKKKPNDKVKLTVVRGKETKAYEVTLGLRPTGPGGGRGGPRPGLGIQVEAAQGGVLISEITPQGPADKAGLKVDDLITQIDGTPISDRRVINKVFFNRKEGEKVKVAYQRGTEKKEVEVTLAIVNMAPPGRPNAHVQLGGQIANAQEWQGPDGVNSGGVFKSTDKGETWMRINSLNERPFYFSVIRVDPTDDTIIYSLGVDLYRSTDGGKKFSAEGINGGLHSDQHDLWVNPKNSRHLIVGCDGGFYVTYDKAANWEHLNRVALGQFYHVCVDDRRPYRVYGGLQDNGSWGGPSNTQRANGAVNEDWLYVNGGDGFVCRVDSSDPDIVYAESQDGGMMRRNLRTGASSFVRPLTTAGLGRLRFNWNTPFILSNHNPRIFYCAGNYVFRSVKQGDDMRAISPEITRTKRGSGTALSESPRNPDVVWVGSDDGAVHITRDGGRTWTNVSENFKSAGLPGSRWVSSIEASRWEEGRAYVVFDGHRSDDDAPYLFVTEDFGVTWKSLRANLPPGSTRVLREDIRSKELLYAGTEFAAYASIDRGASWTKINGDSLPTVAVHEFAQPTSADEIVVATHGRSLWVLDVAALRQYTPVLVKSSAPKLLNPPAAIRWQVQPGGTGPFGESQRKFVGKNPARGATIDYLLPQKAGRVALKVVDVAGKTVAELKATNEPGLHRATWNLQVVNLPRPQGIGEAELMASPFGRAFFGTPVATGTYRAVLTVDGQEQSVTLQIDADPNAPREAIGARDEVEEERANRQIERSKPAGLRDD